MNPSSPDLASLFSGGAAAANPATAGLQAISGLAAGGPSSAQGESDGTNRTGDKNFNFGGFGNPNAPFKLDSGPTLLIVAGIGVALLAVLRFSK